MTCEQCGTWNMSARSTCRKCGGALADASARVDHTAANDRVKKSLSLVFEDGSVYTMPGTSATVGRGEQAADAQPDLDLTPHGGADRKNGVSRRHARLLYDGGRFHVIDAGSRNGTFVDGRRVPADQPIPLHDGAVLAFGGLETVVSIDV